MIDRYYEELTAVLTAVKNTQQDAIKRAAAMVADTLKADGIVYIFGCGHSHLLALDCFYRAGGLANVSAILDTDLMLHNGAAKSSAMEKMSGLAPHILRRYGVTEKDTLIVVSTSGKNAVPVEMAQTAKAQGIPTIAVVSSAYFDDKSDLPKLYECADLYIDNCVPHGDAVMEIDGVGAKMGSVSTAAGSFILQSLLLEAAALAARDGADVPVYQSGNVDGGAQYNQALIDAYLPRIKHL